MKLTWCLLLCLSACGSLADDVLPPDAGSMMAPGLSCAADDPCTCDPCTSTMECSAGLSCVEARRKGSSCADLRHVCLVP